MHQLDNLAAIGRLDRENMLESVALFPRQLEQAWQETKKIKLPPAYKKVNKIVINGMGGSGLGTHLIRSVYFKDLKLPLGNIHSYDLPGLVDKQTLYIISSYSGTTEEPLNTIKEAQQRGAKLLGITSGGELAELIEASQFPGYVFVPQYNPCAQPRIGLGYSLMGILGLLSRLGFIKVNDQEVHRIIERLDRLAKELVPKTSLNHNDAKQLADQLYGHIPIIVAAEFLSGNAHVLANQFNESAKNFSAYFLISELNHHLLEGLARPGSNRKNLHFVFLKSRLYNSRQQKRFIITADIVKQNKLSFSDYLVAGDSPLEQALAMVLFGSYASFYLAVLNGTDPSAIPYVDYLKKQLRH
ncbi:MAG TPA: bifunctional phosphoglucose/phosphomannose isomerase [bacterium]|nr:bifunctional phosphoglucose/phosphomannose isomerase [bacterium]